MGNDSDKLELIIDSKQQQIEYLKDIIQHRELCYFFAWRDILVRYKQAFFGIAWALVRPILNMIVFVFIFGRIAKLPSDEINYSVFVLAAMLPWQLFANATVDTCNCLVVNAPLVSKVYFPRLIIPISEIVVHLVDFSVAFILFFTLAMITGSINFATFFAFPLFLGLLLLLCLGVGFWLSALTVQYRDFRILVTFFVQFGLFISPVGYGTFLIPENWLWLYFLNPMVGIIDGFRWAFFGTVHPTLLVSLTYSIVITTALILSGYFYFRKMERTFADDI